VHPVLFNVGGAPVLSYAVFVGLGFLAAYAIRRQEVQRLGYTRTPGHRFVALGALVGAMIGSKVGMVLFAADMNALWAAALNMDFTGKTVVGGIGGAYIGVEVCKRIVGIKHSTGDAFAVSVPVAQALGRIGCFLHGCCPGSHSEGMFSVGGRLPQQLYESVADFGLAGALWAIREKQRPAGELFRYYLAGYAMIRFVLELIRDDAGHAWLLTPVQWVCAGTVLAVTLHTASARVAARVAAVTGRASSEPPPAHP
jgi:prolipoprotein diacylglyceryltransferase